eukprot:g82105.t1
MRLRVKMEAEQIVRAHREAERRKTDAEGVRQAHLDQIKFQVGDIVLLYHPQVPKGVSSKLFTHWKGPYQIMEQTGPLNYKIRAVGTPEHARCHSTGPMEQLKPTSKHVNDSDQNERGFFLSNGVVKHPPGADWLVDNYVITSHYTVLNFIPKNLFEQFHNVANLYFLFIGILQNDTSYIIPASDKRVISVRFS